MKNNETVREWKDRMEVESRARYMKMDAQLERVKANCDFAMANSDNAGLKQFAEIIKLITIN